MRLLACYSLAARLDQQTFRIVIPDSVFRLADTLFGDRLDLSTEGAGEYQFTHLGLRDILPQMLRGKRYILPFFQVMRVDRKRHGVKHGINESLIEMAAKTGYARLPRREAASLYQGYMELTALPQIADVEYQTFVSQASLDLPALQRVLQTMFPLQPDTTLMAFPSGSAHQIIPARWAREHLPTATFCFHSRDPLQADYRDEGLPVELFDSVEGLLTLASRAQRTLATDSFPSHVLQTYRDDAIIALTQQPRSRIVNPGFRGVSIASTMACSPCRNKVRDGTGCDRGFSACQAWADEPYARAVGHTLTVLS